MPLYEYKCKNCGEVIERICAYKDRPKTVKCPKCSEHAEYNLTPNAFCKWQWEGACSVGFGTREHMKRSGLNDIDIDG